MTSQDPSHVDEPQVERAYRCIKAAIVDGRYLPGAPLSEVMLARAHGMSRTPVREGLTRLWQERYLDRVAGHGYFVARVTVQSIHDTFDVRRLLEGEAAARAATLATQPEIEQLRALARVPYPEQAEPQAAAGEGVVRITHRDASIANVRFHTAIAAAARNGLAQELIERCLSQIDRFISLGAHFGPLQEGATEAHLGIVEAIAARDAEAARRRMEEHLDWGSRLMKDTLLRGQVRIGVD